LFKKAFGEIHNPIKFMLCFVLDLKAGMRDRFMLAVLSTVTNMFVYQLWAAPLINPEFSNRISNLS
jgi:hypothetical protein